MPEEARGKAVAHYRDSVGRFQSSAFHNLRRAIANTTIFLAVVSAFAILTGDATPATLLPMAASVLGGALGASTYAVREEPLARRLLVAAVVLGVIGLAGVVVATQVTA
ncbi:hypothetical protein [Micromonospora carbonacea]|uniref:VIT family protein n=1 Tax=Micromonospora carbonacea TaxID=47853 RepID=A0A1C4XCT1_9ACTN|nr:hypothetical protein [Micromonospora carbonacea]SCF06167.1 hypothetical protein GA0070563_104386 [Micromonospora carbonacea]